MALLSNFTAITVKYPIMWYKSDIKNALLLVTDDDFFMSQLRAYLRHECLLH